MNKNTIFMVTILGFMSCTGAVQAQPVAPNKLFPDPFVNVHAPNSEGWFIVNDGEREIDFAKKVTKTNDNYLAKANVFPIMEKIGSPDITDPNDFMNIVKKHFDYDVAGLFSKNADISYKYSESRGYPCVNIRMIDDGQEIGRKFQIIAIVCHHPKWRSLAFSASFAHKGKVLDNEIEAAAQSFLDGVDIPR